MSCGLQLTQQQLLRLSTGGFDRRPIAAPRLHALMAPLPPPALMSSASAYDTLV